MSDDPRFHEAIEREIVWKGDEFRAFAVALVELALASHEPTFTTDIVPDDRRGSGIDGKPGTGIAGSVVQTLKTAHVIEPVGHLHQGKFFPDKVVSTRDRRNSSPIGVYRLVSPAIAREFLRRHRRGTAPAALQRQPEFGIELPRPVGALAN